MRRGIVLEAIVALLSAALFTVSCLTIDVDPEDRVGQVSALASIGLRFIVVALALIGLVTWSSRRRMFDTVWPLACAALAGMLTGMIAGGIVVALDGTRWGLNGAAGDVGELIRWARALRRGADIPTTYPPLPVHVHAWWSTILDLRPEYSLKSLQIACTAALGPVCYVCWRLVLRPGWALGIGLIAAIPLIQTAPYKPYGNVVLIVLVPLLVRYAELLRTAADRHPLHVARSGIFYGTLLGLLFLTYSGWFQWAAPGVFITALILSPKRDGRVQLATLVVTSLAAFLLVAGRYLFAAFGSKALADGYMHFDVYTDPAYVAMYRGDLPGMVTMWPPLGELGGVGVFTVILAAGVGIAIAVGKELRTLTVLALSLMSGAWLYRFWLAHSMAKTKLVQLYPRTTMLILYCLLILAGVAVFALLARHRRTDEEHPIHGPHGRVGAFCALVFVIGSAGSSIANGYMPIDTWPFSLGRLAWTSHHTDQFLWGQRWDNPKAPKASPEAGTPE